MLGCQPWGPDSFEFTSSFCDLKTTNVVLNNLTEFGCLAAAHGYSLRTEREFNGYDHFVFIRLYQSSMYPRRTQLIDEMRKVVHRKIMEYHNFLRNSTKHEPVVVKKLPLIPPPTAATKIEREKNFLHGWRIGFLQHKSLKNLITSDQFSDYIHTRLSKVHKDDCKSFVPPFTKLEKATNGWHQFLRLFLTKSKDVVLLTLPEKKILDWFCENEKQFRFYEKDVKKMKMTEDFLLENVIGSVHFIQRSGYWISLAIVDSIIARWGFDVDQGKALTELYYEIREKEKDWPKDCMLATKLEVSDEFSDLFSQTSSQTTINENEKVIRWIANNFEKIQLMDDFQYSLCGVFSFVNLCFLNLFHSPDGRFIYNSVDSTTNN